MVDPLERGAIERPLPLHRWSDGRPTPPGPVSVGRRYAAPSEHYPLSTSELGCVWRRSKKLGLNLDQKLLYILLHLQNWVSTARDAMVQSYEPEKMWPPVRYYGAPGGVNRGGRF